ncbi:recombinase RmuC [Cereibacter sphaeroides]|uniref:DNA topoisomerase n=1 Tax=Cereibacter sphaeroides TaxID=1063 RepID=UPI001F2A4C48|nr:DNA topoisomerase [Cereibacter sphaeroides]MCE6959249.1 recombinase RmuC [Cereibacter sphaeroides]MCE6972052.1 recombinase RmuC [Cereibacter sphaeroides]
MAKSVVICEKPSQARALKAALGTRYGEILPACGHLLTLKEPDDVREDWKTWSAGLLWPGRFYEKKVIPDTRKYLDAIRAALRDAERVIVATDCDREGQLIGDEIVEFLGFRGETLRAIFNAEDPKSLQEAFGRLRPDREYRGLYDSGQAREQADQVTNLSLTRTATVTLKEPGAKGAIGIGRVKTPVLGIVCKRELEILNFKPQDLYEIDAGVKVTAGHLMLTCARLPASLMKEQDGAQAEEEKEELAEDDAALEEVEPLRGKIQDKALAEGLKTAVIGYKGPVRSRAERRKQAPPKLFDLTALQSTASARFGWSGDKTLDVAQKLYSERTLITYPRGEAKYLPENNIGDIPKLVPALLKLPDYGQHAPLLREPVVRKGKSGHFSDKALEGLSHYAIIPNVNTSDSFSRVVPQLSPDEARLFDLIVRQYLAALAPDHEYRQTTVWMPFAWRGHEWDFRASGRVPLVAGWKAIFGAGGKGEDDEPELPAVKDGETGEVLTAKLSTVTTKPPARYTEGSLIRVMQEAWRLVDDPALRERLKEAKGIGTPATRGDVVKGLLQQGQIVRKAKSLMPTEGGLQLYKVLMEVCPNVVDPGRTAIWETLFDRVEKKQMSSQDAVAKILQSAQAEIERISRNAGAARISIGKAGKPSEKMAAAAKTIAERKKIPLPKGALTDATVCRRFLEEHLPKREDGAAGGGPVAPSEKQVALAESLAQRLGRRIPEAARASSRELSAWIDEAMKAAPPRPPSEKQLALAERLAEEKGVDLPPAARTDMKACSAFIDAHMTGSRGGGTSGRGSGFPPRRPVPAR